MKFEKAVAVSLVTGIVSFTLWNAAEKKKCCQEITKKEEYIQVLEKWLFDRQNGCRLEDYLIKHGIYIVGIYGYGVLGRLLYKELKESSVTIKCIFDRNLRQGPENIPVINPSKKMDLLGMDAIIVTPICEFEKIKEELKITNSVRILSLEDILAEI